MSELITDEDIECLKSIASGLVPMVNQFNRRRIQKLITHYKQSQILLQAADCPQLNDAMIEVFKMIDELSVKYLERTNTHTKDRERFYD